MKTKLSDCRRTLIPITDTLTAAMADFRSCNSGKNYPDTKILIAFAEAGARIWEAERQRHITLVTVAKLRPEPIQPYQKPLDDDFPFSDSVFVADIPKIPQLNIKSLLESLE